MSSLLVQSNPLILWKDIIHQAESACTTFLDEKLESYLVFLMMRYMDKPEIVKKIIAPDFLKGLQQASKQRDMTLQGVGDTCLIFSGLFPDIAEKRLLKISYFVNMGQSAYDAIATTSEDLFHSLAEEFVPMMDVLQCIRVTSQDLLPLQAFDQWAETGSKRAFSIFALKRNSLPVKGPKKNQ